MEYINTLKKSTKHDSFSDSIHGKGDMKPTLMDPNICYTTENILFWGCRKQKIVQSGRSITKFKGWSITHTWASESSNIYKTININLGFNFIF